MHDTYMYLQIRTHVPMQMNEQVCTYVLDGWLVVFVEFSASKEAFQKNEVC